MTKLHILEGRALVATKTRRHIFSQKCITDHMVRALGDEWPSVQREVEECVRVHIQQYARDHECDIGEIALKWRTEEW